jgi:hypothetical protein
MGYGRANLIDDDDFDCPLRLLRGRDRGVRHSAG